MRFACIDVFEAPLQLLLRRHPEQANQPVAVVDIDQPQGVVEWSNEAARRSRVLPGIRYAAALSLSPDLFARAVPTEEVQLAMRALVPKLRAFSPFVEPSTEEPGVFWLCASGLLPLHRSLDAWARAVGAWLSSERWQASMAVGFDRFATYAVARSRPGALHIFERPADEAACCHRVRLDCLRIEPAMRDELARLSVHTVGDFLALPKRGLSRRFGAGALRLRRMASGEAFDPLRPAPPEPDRACDLELEWAESRLHPLLFHAKRLLDGLLARLAARRSAVAHLRLDLELDLAGGRISHALRPAAPTLDAGVLIDLVRLRLEAAPPLVAGVVSMHLEVEEVPARGEQLRLFAALTRRDLKKGAQALARIRAELGASAVGRFTLREGHLPEARFAFEPGVSLEPAAARPDATRALMRRVHERPLPLPSPGRLNREDGWQPRRMEQGPIVRLIGPHVISGGWWRREQRRDYYFAHTRRGDVLWVFYDRDRRAWFECGVVD